MEEKQRSKSYKNNTMKVSKGYKVELKLNNKQRTMLLQHAGAARYAYNWGLRKRIDLYEKEKKSTNAIEQHRELNKEKQSTLAWMYSASKCAPQEAFRTQVFMNLDDSWNIS